MPPVVRRRRRPCAPQEAGLDGFLRTLFRSAVGLLCADPELRPGDHPADARGSDHPPPAVDQADPLDAGDAADPARDQEASGEVQGQPPEDERRADGSLQGALGQPVRRLPAAPDAVPGPDRPLLRGPSATEVHGLRKRGGDLPSAGRLREEPRRLRDHGADPGLVPGPCVARCRLFVGDQPVPRSAARLLAVPGHQRQGERPDRRGQLWGEHSPPGGDPLHRAHPPDGVHDLLPAEADAGVAGECRERSHRQADADVHQDHAVLPDGDLVHVPARRPLLLVDHQRVDDRAAAHRAPGRASRRPGGEVQEARWSQSRERSQEEDDGHGRKLVQGAVGQAGGNAVG